MLLESSVSQSPESHSLADPPLAMNMMVAFYAATFPGIVQDLPEVVESEREVIEGTREYGYTSKYDLS